MNNQHDLRNNAMRDLNCMLGKNSLQEVLLGRKVSYKGYIFSYTPLESQPQPDSLLLCAKL